MKSGFALENAGWPAFLINQAGSIIRANHVALKLFGSLLEADTVRLAAVWSAENRLGAQQFLEQCPGTPMLVSLRNDDEGTTQHLGSICFFTKEDQKFFLFQLLPAPDLQTAEA